MPERETTHRRGAPQDAGVQVPFLHPAAAAARVVGRQVGIL